ncbi:proton-translocating transhydrogenase family protein, partial [Streptomyces sp. NPDC002922]|uniref:proton-translocating transhydrogenase family protein n=1 Tax=Streptomyces sp. NPDC002922 TaxID=3154439 RepID=UPI00339EB657
VVHDGESLRPRPPVAVSAAPATAHASSASAVDPAPPRRLSPAGRYGLIGLGMLALFALIAVSPPQLASNFTVFALAVVIGYYVIGKVHHALHTPLMSVTNAISGIVVVGALLQIGHPPLAISVLAFLAILLTTVNIFGGFAVTRRMLGMFSKG